MVGWHHQLNGHEFEQTPGDSEGQGSLVCFSPWGCEELDTTEWLNSNNNNVTRILYYLKLSLYWFSTVLVPVNLWLLSRVLTNFIHKKQTNKQTKTPLFIECFAGLFWMFLWKHRTVTLHPRCCPCFLFLFLSEGLFVGFLFTSHLIHHLPYPLYDTCTI